MSGSAAGQLGSPASPQDPPEDDEPDFVHSYVEDFTIERYGPRVRLLVHSDELQRTLRAAGLRCAELEDVASGVAPWRECRRAARALLARCRPTRAALDCLLDAVLGIDEAGLLPHLHQAPLRTLRLYDLEHTHLLRPPWESWTPYAELRAVVALVSRPRLCLAPPLQRQLLLLASQVPANGVLADLGAGTGRCAATCALLRPDVTCHSFELVAGRVRLARRARRRLGVRRERCPIVRRNLATSRHPLRAADLYFMFSPFSPATLRVVLAGLRAHAAWRPRFLLVLKAMEWMDETAEGAHEPPWGLDEWLRPFANARLPQGLRAFSTRPGCTPVPE